MKVCKFWKTVHQRFGNNVIFHQDNFLTGRPYQALKRWRKMTSFPNCCIFVFRVNAQNLIDRVKTVSTRWKISAICKFSKFHANDKFVKFHAKILNRNKIFQKVFGYYFLKHPVGFVVAGVFFVCSMQCFRDSKIAQKRHFSRETGNGPQNTPLTRINVKKLNSLKRCVRTTVIISQN